MARKAKGLKWNESFFTLKDQIRDLPPDFAQAVGAIFERHANAAKTEIHAAYAERTGNLRRGLKVKPLYGKKNVGAVLTTRAPHAKLYESGTKERRTRKGWPRGSTKPRPTFGPISNRHQEASLAEAEQWLLEHGASSVRT